MYIDDYHDDDDDDYAYGWFSVRVVVGVFHSEDFCLPNFNAMQWTASVHTLHMSKPVM